MKLLQLPTQKSFMSFLFFNDICCGVRYDIQIPFLQLVVTKGIEAKNSPNIFNG